MRYKYIQFDEIYDSAETVEVLNVVELTTGTADDVTLARMVMKATLGMHDSTTLVASNDLMVVVGLDGEGAMLMDESHPDYLLITDSTGPVAADAQYAVERILRRARADHNQSIEAAARIRPAPGSPNGTSFHGHEIVATYDELQPLLGEEYEVNGDKTHCVWWLEAEDERGRFQFTVYDYKEYHDPRSTNLPVNWHIGARPWDYSNRAHKLLKQLI